MGQQSHFGGVRFSDIQTRGFLVLRGFLSAADIAFYREDFERQPLDANRNYRIARSSPAANARLRGRIDDVLARVNGSTDLCVDFFDGGVYFSTGPKFGIRFPWHQDSEPYFRFQNHYDYLNFYIPIVKPRRDKSNLCVLPFDVLASADPQAHRYLYRSGASALLKVGGVPIWTCWDSASMHRMRVDVESLAETPYLHEGDLLLMRGDLVHRTQDSDTERVAISFRVARSSAVIERRRLVAGGHMKAVTMVNNAGMYRPMFLAFDRSGCERMRADEMRAALADTTPVDTSSKAFRRYLLMEKAKSGVLGRYLLDTTATKTLDWCARAIHGWQRRMSGLRPQRSRSAAQ